MVLHERLVRRQSCARVRPVGFARSSSSPFLVASFARGAFEDWLVTNGVHRKMVRELIREKWHIPLVVVGRMGPELNGGQGWNWVFSEVQFQVTELGCGLSGGVHATGFEPEQGRISDENGEVNSSPPCQQVQPGPHWQSEPHGQVGLHGQGAMRLQSRTHGNRFH